MLVLIDFPKDGEVVRASGYTLRIDAPRAASVQVSIDGGPWRACRPSVGLWWFDWAGYAAGEHCAVARTVNGIGELSRSPIARFLSV